jgi:hypothetical protein
MYLDAGQPASNMRHEACQPFEIGAPQPVREPVHQHRVKTGVTGHNLPGVASRGIAFKHDRNFFFEASKHGGGRV